MSATLEPNTVTAERSGDVAREVSAREVTLPPILDGRHPVRAAVPVLVETLGL